MFAGLEAEGAGIVGFVAAWTVMMVAMMLPSAAPFVLLYRRGADGGGDDPDRSPKRPITLRTFGPEGAPNAGFVRQGEDRLRMGGGVRPWW